MSLLDSLQKTTSSVIGLNKLKIIKDASSSGQIGVRKMLENGVNSLTKGISNSTANFLNYQPQEEDKKQEELVEVVVRDSIDFFEKIIRIFQFILYSPNQLFLSALIAIIAVVPIVILIFMQQADIITKLPYLINFKQ